MIYTIDQECPNYDPPSGYYWPASNSENLVVYLYVCILSILQTLKKSLIMIGARHSITVTIQGTIIIIHIPLFIKF